jgi:hypothetical protein
MNSIAKMYAEMNGLRKTYQRQVDFSKREYYITKQGREARLPDFTLPENLHILFEILEWWCKDPCQEYSLYYSGGHYKLSLMRDIGEYEPYTVNGSDPDLPTAIVSALTQMKEG